MDFITTDTLFWYSVFITGKLNNEKGFSWVYEDRPFADPCALYEGIIKRIELCSIKAFVLDSNSRTEEFYFQDSYASYSYPDCPLTNNEMPIENPDSYRIKFDTNTDVFLHKSMKFLKSTLTKDNKTSHFFCPLGTNFEAIENTVRSYLKKCFASMVKIKPDEKALVKGMKEIKYRKGVYFFEKSFTPTTFCPETLMGLPETEYYILCEAESNPTDLFDYWYGDSNKVKIEYLINMENLADALDFFYVISVTQNNLLNAKQNIKKAIAIYYDEEGKEAVMKYMKLYKMFCRTCLYFFDSFERKASLERMNETKKRIKETFRQLNNISSTQQTIFKNIVESFDKKTAPICINFQQYNKEDLLNAMEHCANLIINNPTAEVETLELEIRSLGARIYDILITGTTPIICAIRSGGSFLQNIIGKRDYEEVKKYFVDLVKKLKNKQDTLVKQSENKTKIKTEQEKKTLIDNLKLLMTPQEINNFNFDMDINSLKKAVKEKAKKQTMLW